MITPTTLKWIAAARRADQSGGATAAMHAHVEASMVEFDI